MKKMKPAGKELTIDDLVSGSEKRDEKKSVARVREGLPTSNGASSVPPVASDDSFESLRPGDKLTITVEAIVIQVERRNPRRNLQHHMLAVRFDASGTKAFAVGEKGDRISWRKH